MLYKQNISYFFVFVSVLLFLGVAPLFASTIVIKSLVGISITHPADKLTYNVGEQLDIAGLEITGNYTCVDIDDDGNQVLTHCVDDDGNQILNPTQVEVITPENITGFNSSTPVVGQILTITVDGKTTTYTVDIVAVPAPVLSSIAIATPANKLTYTVGDALDIAGLVVVGTYSDSTTGVIEDYDISGFDSSAPASAQIITISVGEIQATFTVKIVAATEPAVKPLRRISGGGSTLLQNQSQPEGEVLGAFTGTWAEMTPAERAEILKMLLATLENIKKELATLIAAGVIS